ncbi:MAG: serine/threonine-protein kinase [Polyangiaceae bacterium]
MKGLAPGEVLLERFRVIETLGRGAMGVVYRVDDLQAGAGRVIKLMNTRALEDPRARQRFEREAELGKTLQHPNIVAALESGELPDGGRYLLMEFAPGDDLTAWLDQHPQLENAQRLDLCVQLLSAAAAAHGAGVVHRDLKPDNIRVAGDGAQATLRILDFGISKSIALVASHTEAGLGTPMWTAPEQGSEGYVPTKRDDVWALGLLVFYVLSGKVYWRSVARRESAAGVALELIRSEIQAASMRSAELGGNPLGAGFDRWFVRCVNRDPSARFADAGEALEALMENEIEPSDDTTAPAEPERAEVDRPRGFGLPAPLVVGLLVGTAALMWLAIYLVITQGR